MGEEKLVQRIFFIQWQVGNCHFRKILLKFPIEKENLERGISGWINLL